MKANKITKDLFIIEKIAEEECINSRTANMDRTEERIYKKTGKYHFNISMKTLGGIVDIERDLKTEKDAKKFITKLLKEIPLAKKQQFKLKKEAEKLANLKCSLEKLENKISNQESILETLENKLNIINKVLAN